MSDPIADIERALQGFAQIRRAESDAEKAVRNAHAAAEKAGRGKWVNDHAASHMAAVFTGGDTDAPVFVPECPEYDQAVAELKEIQQKNDTDSKPILDRVLNSNFGDLAEEAIETANNIELGRAFLKTLRVYNYLQEAFEGY